MKYLILATAASIALSGFAAASQRSVGQPQMAVPATKIAMGPTSAPQTPGGTVDGAKDFSSKCLASGSCATSTKGSSARTSRVSGHPKADFLLIFCLLKSLTFDPNFYSDRLTLFVSAKRVTACEREAGHRNIFAIGM